MRNSSFLKIPWVAFGGLLIFHSLGPLAAFTEEGLLHPPEEGIRIRSHLKFDFPNSCIPEKTFRRIHEGLSRKEAGIVAEHEKWLDAAHILDRPTVERLRKKNFALYSVSLIYNAQSNYDGGSDLSTYIKTATIPDVFISGSAGPLTSSSIHYFKDTSFMTRNGYVLQGIDDIGKGVLQEDLLGTVGGKKKYQGLFEMNPEMPENPEFEQACEELNDRYQGDLGGIDLPIHPDRGEATWEGSYVDSEQILRFSMRRRIKDVLEELKSGLLPNASSSSGSEEIRPVCSVLGVMVHVHTMQDPCSICSYSLFKEQHNCQRAFRDALNSPKNYQAKSILRKMKNTVPNNRNFLGEQILEGLEGLVFNSQFNFLITLSSRRGYTKTLAVDVEKSHWTARDESSGSHASKPLGFKSIRFLPFLPLHHSVHSQVLKPNVHGKLGEL